MIENVNLKLTWLTFRSINLILSRNQLFQTTKQKNIWVSGWIFLCNEKAFKSTNLRWIIHPRCFSLCSTSFMMAQPITFWQRISQEISMFFRRLTQCFGNCFQTPDEDQLLRDGPSQSASVENNFNASIVSINYQ